MKAIKSSYNNFFKEFDVKEINGNEYDIKVDKTQKFQKIIGFGGAITDSSGYLISEMSKENREKLLRLYYSKEGLNYNLARLTIGSCDFSVSDYDYIKDYEGDIFSLEHDEKYIIPFVKDAMKLSPEMKIVSSVWSVPAFYKTNGEKCHGGELKEECYGLAAKYFTNYVKAMNKEGINIYGVSMQNEPEAVQSWESCLYSPEKEIKLFKEINKSFKENSIDTKLYLWDHNRDAVLRRAEVYYKDDEVLKDSAGIFYHWYDKGDSENLSKVHELAPQKELIFSEGCIELLNLNKDDPSSALASMANGLRYGKNYILDSLNYSNGFIDWNIVLNENGGPNHVGNYCEAPVLYNEKTKELLLMPSYFVIKHFSHFIPRGSYRIGIENKSKVLATAFETPKNEIITVLMNENKDVVTLKININGKIKVIEMEGESIITLVD